jgi:NOL1/NOP2/fmu family ribosome biogenesis protein
MKARKNNKDLTEEQAKSFIAGESQMFDADLEGGYVVLSFMGEVIGCGLYAKGMQISQLPEEPRLAVVESVDSSRGDIS